MNSCHCLASSVLVCVSVCVCVCVCVVRSCDDEVRIIILNKVMAPQLKVKLMPATDGTQDSTSSS